MTRLNKYVQTPSEEKRYAIEYADWLDSGEAIVDVDFEIVPVTSPPLAVGLSNIATGETGVGSQVKFFIGGGVDATSYTLLVTITTTTEQIKQDTVLFAIRDAT